MLGTRTSTLPCHEYSRLTNPRASEDMFLKAGRTPDGPHQLPTPPRILLSMPYNEHVLGTHMR